MRRGILVGALFTAVTGIAFAPTASANGVLAGDPRRWMLPLLSGSTSSTISSDLESGRQDHSWVG
jgi:hypothetical protein